MKSATRIQYHTYTIRTPATAVAFIRHTRIQMNVGMEPTLPIYYTFGEMSRTNFGSGRQPRNADTHVTHRLFSSI